MPRKARVVAPGVPHHVTQRGNRRQATFLRQEDYLAYLQLAGEAFAEAGVQVWCWCLMPNHVHLIATPADEAGLAKAVGLTHLRYTRLINGRERWTGYLWQGRFASFPMDDDHLRQCVRYVGLNPVRAGLVERAVDWPWSSVRAHLGRGTDPFLTPEPEKWGHTPLSRRKVVCFPTFPLRPTKKGPEIALRPFAIQRLGTRTEVHVPSGTST